MIPSIGTTIKEKIEILKNCPSCWTTLIKLSLLKRDDAENELSLLKRESPQGEGVPVIRQFFAL